MNRRLFLLLSLAAQAASVSPASAEAMPDTILRWARLLVREVPPENNMYGSHPTYVEWSDDANGRSARNRSVCSSLANHLLERSFGYTPSDIDTWFAKRVPQAVDYYETIRAGRGFQTIASVSAIRPGDLLAVAYPAGSHPTGHVMIADSVARARRESEPMVPATSQYEIDVIDSADSGHGVKDTRHRDDGTWTKGVGHGTLRLYARSDDSIAGHSWSLSRHSRFRSQDVRRLVVGRLDAATAPKPSGSPGTSAGIEDEPSADDAPAE